MKNSLSVVAAGLTRDFTPDIEFGAILIRQKLLLHLLETLKGLGGSAAVPPSETEVSEDEEEDNVNNPDSTTILIITSHLEDPPDELLGFLSLTLCGPHDRGPTQIWSICVNPPLPVLHTGCAPRSI